jgi:hypothetical protein
MFKRFAYKSAISSVVTDTKSQAVIISSTDVPTLSG